VNKPYFGVGRSGRSLTIEIKQPSDLDWLNLDNELVAISKLGIGMYNWEGFWHATRWFASGIEMRLYLRDFVADAAEADDLQFEIDRWGEGYGDEVPEPNGYDWKQL